MCRCFYSFAPLYMQAPCMRHPCFGPIMLHNSGRVALNGGQTRAQEREHRPACTDASATPHPTHARCLMQARRWTATELSAVEAAEPFPRSALTTSSLRGARRPATPQSRSVGCCLAISNAHAGHAGEVGLLAIVPGGYVGPGNSCQQWCPSAFFAACALLMPMPVAVDDHHRYELRAEVRAIQQQA